MVKAAAAEARNPRRLWLAAPPHRSPTAPHASLCWAPATLTPRARKASLAASAAEQARRQPATGGRAEQSRALLARLQAKRRADVFEKKNCRDAFSDHGRSALGATVTNGETESERRRRQAAESTLPHPLSWRHSALSSPLVSFGSAPLPQRQRPRCRLCAHCQMKLQCSRAVSSKSRGSLRLRGDSSRSTEGVRCRVRSQSSDGGRSAVPAAPAAAAVTAGVHSLTRLRAQAGGCVHGTHTLRRLFSS